jgi:DNA-directed RNA polymerase specialized sigma24 family protein
VAEPCKTREGSKQAALIAMLRRSEGTKVDEIGTIFGWQPRTVRSAIADAL